ncbi:tripartite tricarboxylate transporter substrate binding protein [Roseiarcaceae bacterium H3SJ34-1]|uniref:Bug family tripartite tricarboxylate transporter substrate binding protein n=1 Tax=Terripilifer ovatus TaxID=3032367 RepID=UPI003AB93640|nr:tripartite tricarboxylate transporter substrate binding protein [Roseiarcaceae bacterium H3SJ34-1]
MNTALVRSARQIAAGFLVAACLGPCLAGAATAQEWPSRTVNIVVPLGAGGGADIVARILAANLGPVLGQSVTIENVTGAGGMVGSARVARAQPDGYQALLGTVGTHAQNQTLYKAPLYDSRTDFEPVALVVDVPIVLVTTNSMPVKTLQEFIAYTKANQAKLQYASPGAGSSNHLACVFLNAAIGVDVTHVPYRGASDLFQDLIAGRVDYFCPTSTAALPFTEESKQLRAISILGGERLKVMPSVPSAAEQGLANFEAGTWFALFLPKGTPATIVKKLNAATVKVLESEDARKRLEAIGAVVVAKERMTPDYLKRYVADEVEKWKGPIERTGVSISQ